VSSASPADMAALKTPPANLTGRSRPESGAAAAGRDGGGPAAENATGDFEWGLHYSKLAVEAPESPTLLWAYDGASRAAVPRRMLHAEALLMDAARAASPAAKRRERLAEAALRIYYHAKWLGERNYARAAEWRYREASRVAHAAKRSVLAAHALSRLGYFLMHWNRPDDARQVLLASEQLNTKSNPLAPYLYGVLERKAAGSDTDRLRAAEDRILSAGKQPSSELEAERQDLVREINFWRQADESPWRCVEAGDFVQALICGCVHIVVAVRRACAGK